MGGFSSGMGVGVTRPSELMARSFLDLDTTDEVCFTSDSLRVRREFSEDETRERGEGEGL